MPPCETEIYLTAGEKKILALQMGLAESLFRKAVWLALGEYPAAFISNWILAQTDHGQLKQWRYETIYPCVAALCARVKGWRTYPRQDLAPEWLIETLKNTIPEKECTQIGA